jgi:putative proteasome-type protease
MTYCQAMRLDEGLVFLSDTRTNAGVDNVGTYRKLHVFTPGERRAIVIQSAGNLATSRRCSTGSGAISPTREPK